MGSSADYACAPYGASDTGNALHDSSSDKSIPTSAACTIIWMNWVSEISSNVHMYIRLMNAADTSISIQVSNSGGQDGTTAGDCSNNTYDTAGQDACEANSGTWTPGGW